MILFDGALGIVGIGLWLFCVIDVITTPEQQVRNLPKLLWLVIVILLFDLGSIAWLVAGRPWSAKAEARAGRTAQATGERGWGPRTATSGRPMSPDDDEEFLAGLKARADEQRRRAREAQGDDPQPGPSKS